MAATRAVRPLIFMPADLTGQKTGGIQSFIRDFVKFSPDDFQIEVVGATEDPARLPLDRWTEVEVGGRTIRYLPVTAAPRGNARARIPMALRYTLALAARRRHVDTAGRVLNFHRAGPPLVLRRDSSPKVQFAHLNVADIYRERGESRWRLLPGAYHRVEDLTIEGMSRVWVVNRRGVDFYRDRHPGVADRIVFLPTWYDDTVFRAFPDAERADARRQLLAELQLPPAARVVLFVGRLEAQKDPGLVVAAFARAARRDPSLHLVVVGAGSLEAATRRDARSEGGSAFHFLGARPRAEVAGLMAASDALLLPSRFEGMPITVLEALASGLPVVATAVGEVPRLVQSGATGWLVDERTPQAVAEAIERVLAIPAEELRPKCVAVAAEYRPGSVLAPVYAHQRGLSAAG